MDLQDKISELNKYKIDELFDDVMSKIYDNMFDGSEYGDILFDVFNKLEKIEELVNEQWEK